METEQIDNIFNQASFLIAKILPTSFQRSSTMELPMEVNYVSLVLSK
jgi:hypothetical protein